MQTSWQMTQKHIKELDKEIKETNILEYKAELFKAKSIALLALRTSTEVTVRERGK